MDRKKWISNKTVTFALPIKDRQTISAGTSGWFVLPKKDRQTISAGTSGWFVLPKKDRQTISAGTSGWFVLAILLGAFLVNTESSGKAKPNPELGSLLTQSTHVLDFKAGMDMPDKDGSLNQEAIMAKAASIVVPFVKNVGQFNSEVKFAADLFAGRFFLTGKELVYSLFKRSPKKGIQADKRKSDTKLAEKVTGKSISFREYFVDKKGNMIDFKSTGEHQTKTVVSYFKGNDQSKWRSGVASYQSISLGNVYHGVEIKLKASGKNVEKIFYVSPRGNVADIKIKVVGVSGLKIAADGRLLFKNSLGELAMRAPVAWQEIAGQRQDVKVSYRLLGNDRYGFAIADDYAKDSTLIIDPDLDTLMASTFLGGSKDESGYGLVLDSSGYVYLTGSTHSEDFPTTLGVYDHTYNPDGYYEDVFISKLNSNLTILLASTYLGGSGDDEGNSLALDSSGNVFLTGWTDSADFPTTLGAYNLKSNGHYFDVFISKLDNNLATLLASTYLGGYDSDCGNSLALDHAGNVYLTGSNSLALDHAGNVYLTGWTLSADFPTTEGAYDRSYDTTKDYYGYLTPDVFVSKLDNNLTRLLASTFLGGSDDDRANSLALDSSGNVYLTGWTKAANFPKTPKAYCQFYKGHIDAFVSKLNSSLTRLLASTYLGGYYSDCGNSLALDQVGNVYLTGRTDSDNFPTTEGAYDRSYEDSQYYFDEYIPDVFVSKLNSDLSKLLASTYLGGYKNDCGNSLALDHVGNVYVTGVTWSTNFPTTPGAYDRTYYGGDVFVSKLNNSLTTLLASTFLGGSKSEAGFSMALNTLGSVYLTGFTRSADFPATPGAYDRTSYGSDVFVSKLNGFIGVNMGLQAERHEVKAFSIVRQYGQIQFLGGDTSILVAQYRIMRRQGSDDFVLIRTVDPSELQNNQFQMQDKYLEKDITYTYRIEAYDASGQMTGISSEKTI